MRNNEFIKTYFTLLGGLVLFLTLTIIKGFQLQNILFIVFPFLVLDMRLKINTMLEIIKEDTEKNDENQ